MEKLTHPKVAWLLQNTRARIGTAYTKEGTLVLPLYVTVAGREVLTYAVVDERDLEQLINDVSEEA